MKKLVVFSLLCAGAALSLAAQSRQGAAASGQYIYAAPITGKGIVNNSQLDAMIQGEVRAWNHLAHPTREEADYVIKGSTLPYIPKNREEAALYQGEYILHLQLFDNYSQEPSVDQYALYNSYDSLVAQFEDLMNNIFMNVVMRENRLKKTAAADEPAAAAAAAEKPDWRNKLLYIDGRAVYAPRLLPANDNDEMYFWHAFGGGLSLSLHFLPFMGVEVGGQVVFENIDISRIDTLEDPLDYPMLSISVPLSLKFPVKPRTAPRWMLEPAIGAELNIPLVIGEDYQRPAPLSAFIGVQPSFNVGTSGALTFNLRFSYDLLDALIGEEYFPFRRFILTVGLGYKHGFINRKK